MAYIGNQIDTGFTSLLKQDLTGASGTTLTLSHAVANENDIALYINNVRQEPISAYTVSNVTVNLTGTVSGTDDIYVIYLARAVQTTVPPDGSVSTAKIASNAVDLTSKVTGVLPVANGGTGQSASAQTAQTFRLAAPEPGDGTAQRLTNWEEVDTDYTRVGSVNWSESGGEFSSATTGTFLCMYNIVTTGGGDEFDARIRISTNSGSNYSTRAYTIMYTASNSLSMGNQFIFTVSNTSTFRLDFYCGAQNSISTNTTIIGDSNYTATGITFVKLGVL